MMRSRSSFKIDIIIEKKNIIQVYLTFISQHRQMQIANKKSNKMEFLKRVKYS